jgi:hypothetical protein
MEALLIAETKGTPAIKFSPDGELYVQGRSLPEDPEKFYTPVLEWIRRFEGSNVVLDVRLEYMNTSSSKQIFTLLSDIKDNYKIKNTLVNWYYEEGDEDGLDVGKEFEAVLDLPFKFHQYAEVLD